MAEIKIVIIVLCVIIIGLCVYIWWLKREVYDFAEKLERCLEDMIDGKEIRDDMVSDESLWGKVNERIKRASYIWSRDNEKNLEEKRKIKGLISDISHQTKTPIANLKMYLEILQDDSGNIVEFLSRIEKQTDKLDFLMQSMVKMSRLETGVIEVRQERNNLYDTIGQAVSEIVPKAKEKKIDIYVKCEEMLPICHDGKWTEEAIFNILDNAVKYTNEGGQIHICVIKQEIFTRISIRDTGKGITVSRQGEIFRRFYREPEVHDQDGIGVGLYLARQIVELQKGYIEVRSEEGKGSDFQIYLPNR